MKEKTIYTNTEIHTIEDPNGNITTTTSKKTTTAMRITDEPDYIKLYTRIWCEANSIPNRWRGLFLEIATRMTYCNANDLGHAQLFVTSKWIQEDICRSLGWSTVNYKKGLAALCDCKALRHVCRSTYQVNPEYAGRGEWHYNPRLKRGGVEELVTVFRMNAQGITSNTEIIWAGYNSGDYYHNELDKLFAKGMGLKTGESGIITQRSTGVDVNADDFEG